MFSIEIEDHASRLFEKLFSREINVEDLISLLKSFQNSDDQENRDIFTCTISNLLQEFKFLGQYPDSELFLTGSLTGALLRSSLIPKSLEGVFIQKIKEFLVNSKDSKLHRFALHTLSYLSDLGEKWPELLDTVSKLKLPTSSFVSEGESKDRQPIPPNKDVILVHLNNLTENNVKEKSRIFGELLENKHLPFLADICSFRAVQEPNYMNSYIELFKNLNSYELIKRQAIVLAAKSFYSAVNEKNYYKNLGTWLGKLTISQNKPLLWNEVNLADLSNISIKNNLQKQYVTFACYLVRQSINSLFKPKNPWTMSILSLLLEIFNGENTSSHTKFEFELLLKKLHLNINEISTGVAKQTYDANLSSIFSLKLICLLSCILSAKEAEEKILKRTKAIAHQTSLIIFERDLKPDFALIHSSVNSLFSCLSYVLIKETIKSHSYPLLKKIFSELSLQCDDKDIWPLMIPSIEETSALIFWMTKQKESSNVYKSSDLVGLYGSLTSILTDLQYQRQLVNYWDLKAESVRAALVQEIKNFFNLPSENLSSISNFSNFLENFNILLLSLQDKCLLENERCLHKLSNDSAAKDEIKGLNSFISQQMAKEENGLLISQKLMQFIFRSTNFLFSEALVFLLSRILESSSKITKEITSWVLHSNDKRKFNEIAIFTLIKNGIIYILDFDIHLSRLIDASNPFIIEFALKLCKLVLFGETPIAAPYDLVFTIDALTSLSSTSIDPSLKILLEDLLSKLSDLLNQQNLGEKQSKRNLSILFTEWFRLTQYPSNNLKQQRFFLDQLFSKFSFTETSEIEAMIESFLESSLEIYSKQRNSPYILSYRSIDAFVSLAVNIITRNSEISLKFFEILLQHIGLFLLKSHNHSLDTFIKPITRMIIYLILEMNKELKDCDNELVSQFFLVFSSFLEVISPDNCPYFALPWIEIICSKGFLSAATIDLDVKTSHAIFLPLLAEIGSFLDKISLKCTSTDSHQKFYKGSLFLFISIAHDLPEIFTLNYEYILARLPKKARQLRNLVLSSIPKNMKLPDPFTFRLSSFDFNSEDRTTFDSSSGYIYSTLYVSLISSLAEADESEIFLDGILIDDFYQLCNTVCDQLRYPSKFTQKNILLLLSIYSKYQEYRENIITCILERLVSHKPHPWGLMVTFLEIIRNEKFSFWAESFINRSPEIRNLFSSIAKTCLNMKN